MKENLKNFYTIIFIMYPIFHDIYIIFHDIYIILNTLYPIAYRATVGEILYLIHHPTMWEIIKFLLAWIIVSAIVWFASYAVGASSSFPRAMLATLGGLIVFAIILVIFNAIGAAMHLPVLNTLSLLFGFVGVLEVFADVFETGFGEAFLIAILAFIIIMIILISIFAMAFAGVAEFMFAFFGLRTRRRY